MDGPYVAADSRPCRDALAHVMVYDVEMRRHVCMFCGLEES